MTTQKPQVALFIDADNMSAKWIKTIVEIAESLGRVVIRFICGKENHLKGWRKREAIKTYQFNVKVAPNGKNKADKLIEDESDRIAKSHPEIDIFCFATHDKHFAKSARNAKHLGKRVINIGKKHTSQLLREVCEFMALDFVLLLKKAFAHTKQESINLAKLGNVFKELDDTYKVKDYGSSQLNKLLKKLPAFVEFSADGKEVKLKAHNI